MSPPPPLVLEGRFARLEAIQWWRQARLAEARVLVVGAGALGNEVVKNLALLGVGRLVIVDRDRVERSNLCRSVLYREADEGRPKAECAARAARELLPEAKVEGLVANVLADAGLGLFRWADVIVGAVDNREARVFVNSAAARVDRPWIDGGIEVLQGIARGFHPSRTACYECTMSQVDWDLINQSRSCTLLARRAVAQRGTPTTPTTASVVGGIQAQEVVKLLHGLDALLGRGFVFEGQAHASYAVRYERKPGCPWHDPAAPIEAADDLGAASPLADVLARGASRLGGADALDLSREIVRGFRCEGCGGEERVFAPLERLSDDGALCPACRSPRIPSFLHSVPAGSDLLRLSAAEAGLPPWDVVWVRRGEASIGIELAADRVRVLGAAS